MCEMKFFIHSQTSAVATVEVWEWISNFIPHFIKEMSQDTYFQKQYWIEL